MNEPRRFNWSERKNEWLKRERSISFEEVAFHINRGSVLDILPNPRYPDQYMYVVRIRDYVWIVPFIQDNSNVFLKTAYPSRKANRIYLTDGRRNGEEQQP